MAPLFFVSHFLEESPGFVEWFNAHVTRGITSDLFWTVNLYGLGLTIIVVVIGRVSTSTFSTALVVAWFSFLMGANAVFHVAAAIMDRGYVPGLVTATAVYLPYYSWLMSRIFRGGRLHPALVAAAALAGATPMLVHGYKILFQSDRLF